MITSRLGIAIVAPAGCIPDPSALERAIARFEEQGFLVRNYYDHSCSYQRFGGTDAARLAQLHAAVTDPEVHLVIALRGGYGLSRLLPNIDFEAIAASGKIVVGFSDLTALHMGLMAKAGGLSYAGPMVAGDFGVVEPVAFTIDDFWACLAGPTHTIAERAVGNPLLDVRGTAWGGNLAVFYFYNCADSSYIDVSSWFAAVANHYLRRGDSLSIRDELEHSCSFIVINGKTALVLQGVRHLLSVD